jgi:hypothetical protein
MTADGLNDELTKAALWALDRILQGEYKEAHDAAGNIDSMVLDRDFAAMGALHRSSPSAPTARSASGSAVSPTAPQAMLAHQHLQELRQLIPHLSPRAKALRAVPHSNHCPEFVRRFLLEAFNCIVYGQFLAGIFLCRSALAESLAVELRKRGFGPELTAVKETGLKGIFRLAHEKGLLDSARYQQAEEIRVLTNQAIHGKGSPGEEECIRIFNATSGIAKDLSA